MPIRVVSSGASSASSNDGRRRASVYCAWGVCGLLLLAIGLIYGQTRSHILLAYDDTTFISSNRHVSRGLTGDGLRWAATNGPYGEWYPLAMMSHMLDCELFGLEAGGHHLTSVLLHAATSIALFLVWWRMTGELWPSAFVAAVFAVHPQHVESVAWVSERKDVLSGLFFVLTLGAYSGYVRHGRSVGRYLLMAVLFTLGLLAKPMIVTLPPLLLLLDFWPLARLGSTGDVPRRLLPVERPGLVRLVMEKLPLVALAVVDGLITLRTHSSGGIRLYWPARLGNAAVSCVDYVADFFYPVGLAAFYPMPMGGPAAWKVAGAIAILVAVSTAAVTWRRRVPYFFVGWFWYLGVLAPVLGVITIGPLAMADRYMYLAGIGLSIAVAWGGARLAAGWHAGRWVLGTCAGLVIAALVAGAFRQTSVWRDDETLWRHALACTADNGKAEIGLADALAREGRLDEAMPHYDRAVQFAFDYHPFNELGLVLARQGKIAKAVSLFRVAVDIEPQSVDARCSLGLALAEQQQFIEAEQMLRSALEIEPQSLKAHRGLAHVLRLAGNADEAQAECELAIELDPRDTAARNELGVVLLQQGKVEDAIGELAATLAIDPKQLAARINLALALTALGRVDEATAQFRQALELDPDNPVARKHLDQLPPADAEQPAP